MHNQDDAAFSFVGFPLLSTLGFFAWRSDPLGSARPVAGQETREEQQCAGQVTARLWQDPLEAMAKRNGKTMDAAGRGNFLLTADLTKALAGEHQLKVLSVMLGAGPYAEIREERRRRRYAVLSALGEAGFAPRNAVALGVAAFPEILDGSGGALPDIPYEWFDRGRQHVLVLWLNDDSFSGEPFRVFQELIDCVGALFPGACWHEDRSPSPNTLWNRRRPS